MRHAPNAGEAGFNSLAGGLLAAVFLAASVLLTADPVLADTSRAPSTRSQPGCTCGEEPAKRDELWPRPKFADTARPEPAAALDTRDEIATLEAVQVALTELGDGQTYVWHRAHGRLSGAFQPTSSFKDATGKVCRHIVLLLASGSYSRKTEGIACRLSGGRWQLEG
jgi:hypothetical protein